MMKFILAVVLMMFSMSVIAQPYFYGKLGLLTSDELESSVNTLALGVGSQLDEIVSIEAEFNFALGEENLGAYYLNSYDFNTSGTASWKADVVGLWLKIQPVQAGNVQLYAKVGVQQITSKLNTEGTVGFCTSMSTFRSSCFTEEYDFTVTDKTTEGGFVVGLMFDDTLLIDYTILGSDFSMFSVGFKF